MIKGHKMELVWTASHHVLEIVLSSVFRAVFGKAWLCETGPFKRFQMEWPNCNHEGYVGAPGEMFRNQSLLEHHIDLISYMQWVMKEQQVPAVYTEILSLSLLLGGGSDQWTKFQSQGLIHHTWKA